MGRGQRFPPVKLAFCLPVAIADLGLWRHFGLPTKTAITIRDSVTRGEVSTCLPRHGIRERAPKE